VSARAGETVRVSAERPGRADGTRYLSLSWRVFAVNAALLLLSGVVVVLVFSPGTVSSPVATKELGIVAATLVAMLVVNRVLLSREVAPLEHVAAAMRSADPLEPVEPLPEPARPSEATDLALAFNDMRRRLEEERRMSTRRALGAQEGERLRIARELHDEVGQQLTALLLQLSSARRQAGPELGPVLAEAHGLARDSLEDIRRVARDLRPEALDDLGLPAALAALGERLREGAGLRVDRDVHPVLPPLDDEEELVIYRVAQEALTNVLRHAGTDRAELSLRVAGDELVLEVRDDGRGFDLAGAAHNGLLGMRERALLVGGGLEVLSRPGAGTVVRLRLRPQATA
jgi:two-component system sensor histidine kinase UhpB